MGTFEDIGIHDEDTQEILKDTGLAAPVVPSVEKGLISQGDFSKEWASQDVTLTCVNVPMDSPERKNVVLNDLKKLVHVGDKLSLVCCELLYEVRSNGYWRDLEYEEDGETHTYSSFEDFSSRELGIERRRAYMLAEFYETYVIKAKVPYDVVEHLPYSKALICKDIVTEENWKDVVNKIEGLSSDNLKSWSAREQGRASDDVKIYKFTARLTEAQWENWRAAYDIAAADANTTDRGEVLSFILMDFIGGQIDDKGGKDALMRLDRIIKNVERAFKVKFGPPLQIDKNMYKDILEDDEVLENPSQDKEVITPEDLFGDSEDDSEVFQDPDV